MSVLRKIAAVAIIAGVAALHGWFNRSSSGSCDGACVAPYQPLAAALQEPAR